MHWRITGIFIAAILIVTLNGCSGGEGDILLQAVDLSTENEADNVQTSPTVSKLAGVSVAVDDAEATALIAYTYDDQGRLEAAETLEVPESLADVWEGNQAMQTFFTSMLEAYNTNLTGTVHYRYTEEGDLASILWDTQAKHGLSFDSTDGILSALHVWTNGTAQSETIETLNLDTFIHTPTHDVIGSPTDDGTMHWTWGGVGGTIAVMDESADGINLCYPVDPALIPEIPGGTITSIRAYNCVQGTIERNGGLISSIDYRFYTKITYTFRIQVGIVTQYFTRTQEVETGTAQLTYAYTRDDQIAQIVLSLAGTPLSTWNYSYDEEGRIAAIDRDINGCRVRFAFAYAAVPGTEAGLDIQDDILHGPKGPLVSRMLTAEQYQWTQIMGLITNGTNPFFIR